MPFLMDGMRLTALDQILQQLMEGNNSTRPVPATDEIMEHLPREVVQEGSEWFVCRLSFLIIAKVSSSQPFRPSAGKGLRYLQRDIFGNQRRS